jgi:2-oxoisovalerate dehydrogenase E1 component alpha subunit
LFSHLLYLLSPTSANCIAAEIKKWKENDDPTTRMRNFLTKKGWWDEELEQSTRDTERANVLTALEKAEAKPYPSLDTLFYDVYKDRAPNHIEQEEDMLEHARKYPDKYPMAFEGGKE